MKLNEIKMKMIVPLRLVCVHPSSKASASDLSNCNIDELWALANLKSSHYYLTQLKVVQVFHLILIEYSRPSVSYGNL